MKFDQKFQHRCSGFLHALMLLCISELQHCQTVWLQCLKTYSGCWQQLLFSRSNKCLCCNASAIEDRTTSAHSILGVRVKANASFGNSEFRACRIAKALVWFYFLVGTPYLDEQRDNPKEQDILWIDRLVMLISLCERANWIMSWTTIRHWRNAGECATLSTATTLLLL